MTDWQTSKGYKRGSVDNTLFYKSLANNGLIVAQVYVDDIIFGSTSQTQADEFSKTMASEFEMSMVGELSSFLGLSIKQTNEGIFYYLNLCMLRT